MRYLWAAACLPLGAAVGTCTVLLHDYWWGMVLGLAATAATLVALPGGWGRVPFGAAWSVVVVVLSLSRPEGDFLVSADVAGYLLLLGVPVVLVAGLVGVRGRATGPDHSGAGPGVSDGGRPSVS
ncbi:DUF6113 family protein [Nocardioides sp. YIM 152588]|uniref:DUF6113 family protein n=1 Tax=Nocardioides sp. YIM 152588 TaxID=3158259 RepID=UPI0032E37C68